MTAPEPHTGDTGLAPLEQELRQRLGFKDCMALDPIEPMARSVHVCAAYGARLLIEINGKPEAWLIPSTLLDAPQLEFHLQRRNASKARLYRLLVHLCICMGLRPEGRHPTPKDAIEAAVKGLSRNEVQAALGEPGAWEWLVQSKVDRITDVRACPIRGYRVRRAGNPGFRPLPAFLERRCLAAWWLERARQIRERRGAPHVVDGGRRTVPQWLPDLAATRSNSRPGATHDRGRIESDALCAHAVLVQLHRLLLRAGASHTTRLDALLLEMADMAEVGARHAEAILALVQEPGE